MSVETQRVSGRNIYGKAGAALCTVPGVDKVAFTGSLDTGRRVMRACAGDVRPVSLELGGKSALVVFDDAPLEQAVEWAMFGCFWTNGQICSATSRAGPILYSLFTRVYSLDLRGGA